MGLDITTAQPGDVAEILCLQRSAYRTEAERYGDRAIPPPTETSEELLSRLSDHTILRTAIEGRMVGSVRGCEKDNVCQIGRPIVHPGFRRRGIAAALMAGVEAAFPRAEAFELFAGHRSEGNLRLCEGLGYRPFRREQVGDHLTAVAVYQYSTVDGKTAAATYSRGRTAVDGAVRDGFWGLTHRLDAASPGTITVSTAPQR